MSNYGYYGGGQQDANRGYQAQNYNNDYDNNHSSGYSGGYRQESYDSHPMGDMHNRHSQYPPQQQGAYQHQPGSNLYVEPQQSYHAAPEYHQSHGASYAAAPGQNQAVVPLNEDYRGTNPPTGPQYQFSHGNNNYGGGPATSTTEGERGLGATVLGGASGAFIGHKMGGGALGTIGGLVAGAIGANVLENKHDKGKKEKKNKKKHKKDKHLDAKHSSKSRSRSRHGSSSSSSDSDSD